MNPYYIALWIMFFVACFGMYAAFRWGYEVAFRDYLDMVSTGAITVNLTVMQERVDALKAAIDASMSKAKEAKP